MTRYARHVNKRETPQTEQASPKQVKNNQGGYSFQVDHWGRLNRFLVLGSEGGSYYASEKKLTQDNAKALEKCLQEDGLRTVIQIAKVSSEGRAPKNDPAIFALAMAAGSSSQEVRKAALDAIPVVCRTGTHLFAFLESVKNFRGWGRALREAVCKWYLYRKPDNLAYQVVKYQQRNGWSHRDALRLVGGALKDLEVSEEQQAVFRWIVAGPQWDERTVDRNGKQVTYPAIDPERVPTIIEGYERIKKAEHVSQVLNCIEHYGLTHEMVPNQWKSDSDVWGVLLERMPITATLRNLGKLSAVGTLSPLSRASSTVIARLLNMDNLRKGRVHPLSILVALNTYKQGHGVRGKLTWDPVSAVLDALDEAFYLAFGTIEPTGKSRLIALDVSGSMTWNAIAGMPGVTPRVGSAAMAMTTVRTEANYHVVAFSHGRRTGAYPRRSEVHKGIYTVPISKRQRLDDVCHTVAGLWAGGTDCALPMLWAAENKIDVDAIEIYTDSETKHGSIHPHQALERYRQKMGRDCKVVVVGMESNGFSIADPDDAGMLDVVGFDTAAPTLMFSFIKGDF